MNQNEETETVSIIRPCRECGGQGYVCDYNCYATGKIETCTHRANTGCGCQGGESRYDFEIPKSIVEQYFNA